MLVVAVPEILHGALHQHNIATTLCTPNNNIQNKTRRKKNVAIAISCMSQAILIMVLEVS